MRRKQGVTNRLLRRIAPCFALPCLVLVLPWLTACSQQPEPESVAVQEAEATAAAAARTAAENGEGRQEPPRSEPVRQKIVVIQRGGDSHTPTPGELAAASRAEREKHGDRSVGELTDKNLAEVASQGKLTYAAVPANAEASAAEKGSEPAEAAGNAAADEAAAEAAAGEDSVVAASSDDSECDELCWRRRARELRQSWADASAEIEDLEARVADLRWRFYASDDPWQRDSQIKPAWDRALDRLHRTREEVERYGERVDDLMEEGRRAGALPGWLREGVELEPERTAPAEGSDPSEPVEPPLADQEPREPGRQ